MVAMIVCAAVGTALCWGVLSLGKKKDRPSHETFVRVMLIIDFVVLVVMNYLWPPALGEPFLGISTRLSLLLLANAIPIVLIRMLDGGEYNYRMNGDNIVTFQLGKFLLGWLGWMAIVFVRAAIGWPIVQTEHYAGLIGKVEVRKNTEDFEPTDVKHIRMVSEEQAIWSGGKVLGNDGSIGSQFQPGNYSLQKVDGKLKWIAPLDFIDFTRWQGATGIPAYIVVDAEDPVATAELKIADEAEKPFSFQFSPGAYFSSNLARHIWQSGWKKYTQADVHFEIDDGHQPHWVVTLTLPTAGFDAPRIERVLLVDPTTGAIQDYPPDTVPEWVDRVVPEDLAVQYLSHWGRLSFGRWAAYWSGKEVKEPTGSARDIAWLVYGKDGRAHWFTGMTSSSSDQSLISVVTVDSRSGVAREYPMAGITEDAVIKAADSAVSNFRGYHSTAPILYHINGEGVWALPVLSEQHQYQALALVRALNGEAVSGNTKIEALRLLKNKMAQSGNTMVPSELAKMQKLELKIDRSTNEVKNGNSTYMLRSFSLKKDFSVQPEIAEDVRFLSSGDTVLIEYLESTDGMPQVITKLTVKEWAR